jgi:hypothetical protein
MLGTIVFIGVTIICGGVVFAICACVIAKEADRDEE